MNRLVPRWLAAVAALTLVACEETGDLTGPALESFYFPSGLEHVAVPGKTDGVLLVTNANADKRYGAGSVVAVDLDAVGLPPLGGDAAVAEISDLKLTETQRVVIHNFASSLHVRSLAAGQRWRGYVPTRSEGNNIVQFDLTMDGTSPVLSCVGADGRSCIDTGISTTPPEFELSTTGIPRAPQPYSVASKPRACTTDDSCCSAGETGCGRTCASNQCIGTDGLPFADLWVTHIDQADSPTQSRTNFRSYLVHVESDVFAINEQSFVPIGFGASNAAVALGNWVFLSGRIVSPAPNLLRMVSEDGSLVVSSGLESSFRVSDSRGMVASSNGQRLFMVGRVPDSLLVTNVYNADTTYPSVAFVRGVPMVDAATDVRAIARAGQGDLVAVSGSSITTGSVALYDDELGDLASVVSGVGVQPSALAVDHRGSAARLYVGNFGDGRVAVIDVPDLSRPQSARLVAFLGDQQVCLVRGVNSPACQALQGMQP